MDIVLSLLQPDDLESYLLTTEDRIEMRNCDTSVLRNFHMCTLPYESLYFLLGTNDFVEVRIIMLYLLVLVECCYFDGWFFSVASACA